MLKQYSMPVPTREPDGQFSSFDDWVNSATRMIGGENALCVDALNRICAKGGDFMRARDEGAFPVRFYFGAGGETFWQQRRSSDRANLFLHGRVGMNFRRKQY